ncbi:hypothetical protein [Actinomycetospora chibensis]|uniref:O-antigen/teichoic acid export membrane protein n=1 Tax=Actinomycetospora chibensis TaxID=663606 RepID=A0ABV9RFZ6_9PSEU|nr:hypothetical protein [Actinomycetospora chibensis]MDD7922509.1 hypothetical protein [Actinomycetospora chibensis]
MASPAVRAALGVPASQVLLAASGYLVLVMAAQRLPASGFAILSSFYLLVNTIGRGVFVAIELEVTRAMAAAIARGESSAPTLTVALRRAAVFGAAALVLVLVCAPLVLGTGGGPAIVVLLGFGALSTATTYLVRGPLAAQRRFHAYGATWWGEAAIALAGAGVLLGLGVSDTDLWALVFVVAPVSTTVITLAIVLRGRLVARLRLQLSDLRDTGVRPSPDAHLTNAALVWLVLLFLSSQGVWNLVPVFVTSRLGAEPAAAAAFVSVAILIRAPVFVFPAVQALLMPSASSAATRGDREALDRTFRPVLVLLAAGGLLWIAACVSVVPWFSRVVFRAAQTPSTTVLALLGLSTLLGAAAMVPQTKLVASLRHRQAALSWLAGLAVGLGVATVGLRPELAGALAQLAAACAVVGLLWFFDRRAARGPDRAVGLPADGGPGGPLTGG